MELHVESFDLGSVIRDVTTTVAPLMQKNRNALRVKSDDARTFVMHSDVMKVRQVLLNLLSNAAKFTENGTIDLDVDVTPSDGLLWAGLRVTDTGIGMTPEQLRTLFRAFAQADTSTSRRYGGTGLGLAISKRYCELLGGTIAVESDPGRGSTFTVRLPMNIADQKMPVIRHDSAALGPAPAGNGRLILVVDDDASTRDLMLRVLQRNDFRVVTAANGEEGLRLARDLHPDAITLDVILPGMSGWAVLSALKADPQISDIPVVMLTMVDDRNRGIALGASDYVVKPVDAAKLTQMLHKFETQGVAKTAMIVDDDGNYRGILRRVVERAGWTATEAENGKVALQKLSGSRPSVILLDLMMPEMDGYSFLKEFRKTADWAAVPIIVLTSKDLTAGDRAALSGYVDRVLEKGAQSREELEREIADVLNGYVRPMITRAKEAPGA
jgi:CheY-like chemotaxis protein/two-component sensor histidine kinase